MLTSPDGQTWTLQNSSTASDLYAVTWDGGNQRFVAVGAGGTILTSPDAQAWTARLSGLSTALLDVTEGKGGLLAVGEKGKALSSLDGITWTGIGTGRSEDLTSVVWTGKQYLVTGEGGLTLASTDGGSWRADVQVIQARLTAAAWNGIQFVAVGEAGTILASGRADLALSMAATPDPVAQNTPLTIAGQISNTGGLYATNVRWEYALPGGVTVARMEPSQGSCSATVSTVSCDLGAIEPGTDTVSIIVEVTPAIAGTIEHTATLFSDGDPNPVNDTTIVQSTVIVPQKVLEDPDRENTGTRIGALHPAVWLPLFLPFFLWRWICIPRPLTLGARLRGNGPAAL